MQAVKPAKHAKLEDAVKKNSGLLDEADIEDDEDGGILGGFSKKKH